MTRKTLSIVSAAIFGLLFAFSQVALAVDGERIDSFASDITVHADGTISVQESIGYFFDTERHGIYRDIPLRATADDGRILEKALDVRSITDGSGNAWDHADSQDEHGAHIKIGDKDTLVTGSQDYDISYDVGGAIGYSPDHDELYWNATGNDWTVPILRSSATVHLPDGVPADKITFTCYTGPKGSTAKDCLANRQGRSVSFAAQGPLTVVVGWPKGVVATLLPHEIATSLYGVPLVTIPWILFALVFFSMFCLWLVRGRDPRGRGTIVVQYDPPDGMRPGEVGTLMDAKADDKEVSATIVDFAVRGYLDITETKGLMGLVKGHYRFDLKKPYDADQALLPFERQLLDMLFYGGRKSVSTTELKTTPGIAGLVVKQKQSFYDAVMSRGLFVEDPEKVRVGAFAVGILVAAAGSISSGMFGHQYSEAFASAGFAASIAAGFVIFLFGRILPRRTEAGVAALEYAKGFKEYLAKAEKYRLQWQEKEGIFEKFLPYAMVYGVADKWSKAFESMQLQSPSWYHGSSSMGAFNAAAFAGSMRSLSSNVASSGFSGGSSGGGGGGGGGGSW